MSKVKKVSKKRVHNKKEVSKGWDANTDKRIAELKKAAKENENFFIFIASTNHKKKFNEGMFHTHGANVISMLGTLKKQLPEGAMEVAIVKSLISAKK